MTATYKPTVSRVLQGSGAPTGTNDNTTGVVVGDLWAYGTGLWYCSDATTSAAVWTSISGGGGSGVTSVSGTATQINSTGGTTPVLSLIDTAVTPTTYGDSTHVAQITIDQKGRITAASAVAISGGGGSGAIPQTATTEDTTGRTTTTGLAMADSGISAVLANTYASSSSKVRVRVNLYVTASAVSSVVAMVKRGTTDIRPGSTTMMGVSTIAGAGYVYNLVFEFTDSPGHTTPDTYHVWWGSSAGGSTAYMNDLTAIDGASYIGCSSIVLEEITA